MTPLRERVIRLCLRLAGPSVLPEKADHNRVVTLRLKLSETPQKTEAGTPPTLSSGHCLPHTILDMSQDQSLLNSRITTHAKNCVLWPELRLPWGGMNVRVKVCGITNPDDASAAVEAGASALGFILYEASPRNVSVTGAAQIIRNLPPFVAKVAVLVDASEEFIRAAIVECGFDTLQFHGNESPEFCRRFPVKTIKAVRIQNAESLSGLAAYETSAWLLDSFVPDKIGGTGEKFNWDLACAAKKFGRPIILAGGLTPANVADAVQRVQPFAVDVSSGVESKPGKKDHAKIRAFIAAARAG